MLRTEGANDVLRAGGEGPMLRDSKDGRSLRLPLDGRGQAGPEVTTEAVWREFHLRLLAFVSRRVKHRADAEDIVQRVFMDIHRGLPALRASDRLGAWLHRMARNAVVDHYRAPARRREVPSGDTRELEPSHPALAPTVDDESTDKAFAADCLTPMIQLLPATYRRAVELVELRGLSQRVAAEIEGVSVSGMKTRVQRARRHLKASLQQCCRISLDARGGVSSCDTRAPAARACGCPPIGGRNGGGSGA
jgi:RNA polymerase sigma-70 factor (ECF subfamily)